MNKQNRYIPAVTELRDEFTENPVPPLESVPPTGNDDETPHYERVYDSRRGREVLRDQRTKETHFVLRPYGPYV